MGRNTLGELEHQTLLSVLRLGDAAYTAPIVIELEERTGRGATLASVYIVLRRLEAKTLGASELRAAEGPRDRRYFRVTPEGVARLRDARAAYERLWEGLDAPGEPLS
jgi:DNA-binding PadR family transcriptional regulator